MSEDDIELVKEWRDQAQEDFSWANESKRWSDRAFYKGKLIAFNLVLELLKDFDEDE